jgi:hypothetical protein
MGMWRESGSRCAFAAAAVMVASRAMVASRHVPWLGDQIDQQIRGLLGVGSLPDTLQPAA